MDIFTKRRRTARVSPGPQAGLFYRWGMRIRELAPPTPEMQDQKSAERGARLAAFIKGEPVPNVWGDDLEPEFRRIHDAIVDNILSVDPGQPGATEALWHFKGELHAIRKWARFIDETIHLGAGALERMAQGKLRQDVIADTATTETTKAG